MIKKFAILAIAALGFTFSGCEGPQGPMGPEGPEGPVGEVAKVFETEVNFNNGGNYQAIFSFPSKLMPYTTDFVMVYMLWETTKDAQGKDVDIWRPVPQTIFLDGARTFSYNFDHTYADVRLFLNGNFNLSTLPNSYTNKIIFRIAALPGIDASKARRKSIDYDNYDEVVKAYGIKTIHKL